MATEAQFFIRKSLELGIAYQSVGNLHQCPYCSEALVFVGGLVYAANMSENLEGEYVS